MSYYYNSKRTTKYCRIYLSIILLLSFLTIAPNIVSAQNGLNYQYYEGAFDKLPNFQKLKAKKRGIASNFLLSVKKRENKFALVFEGYYDVKKAGSYFFKLISDDGSRLFVNDKSVLENDTKGITKKKSSGKYLSKGMHKIRLEYFDKFDRHRLSLLVKGPDFSFRKIRNSNLYVSTGKNSEPSSAPISSPPSSPSDSEVQVATSTKIYRNKVFNNGPQLILREEDSGTQFINCTFKNYRKGTAIRIEGADNIVIRNCKFIDITNNQRGRDAHAIECNERGKNVIVEGSLFKDLGADGIQLGHKGKDIRNWLIRDNEFIDCGENGLDVKRVQGNIIVQNNYFTGSQGCPNGSRVGCTGDNGTGMVIHRRASGVVVNGNVFYDNVYGLRVAKGARNEPPVNITIKNNFFHKNAKYGLHVFWAGSTFVYNNTFLDNQQTNLMARVSSKQRLQNRNNLFVGKGGICKDSDGKGNLYFKNIDQAGINLKKGKPVLKSSSPAIDKGVSIGRVLVDMYRTERPRSGKLDCGAVEYSSHTNARTTEEAKDEKEASTDKLARESNFLSELRVFPNPANEKVNIVFNPSASKVKLALSLVDTQGKKIWQGQKDNQPEISIPTSHLKSGIYFLFMEGEGVKESRKLLVRH